MSVTGGDGCRRGRAKREEGETESRIQGKYDE
jgi:hypothetical protein